MLILGIILLVVLIILVIFLILQNMNNRNDITKEDLLRLLIENRENLSSDITNFKDKISGDLENSRDKVNDKFSEFSIAVENRIKNELGESKDTITSLIKLVKEELEKSNKGLDANKENISSNFSSLTDRVEKRVSAELTTSKETMTSLINLVKQELESSNRGLTENKDKINENFASLSEKVSSEIKQGLVDSNNTIKEVMGKLGKIEEAQKTMEKFSSDLEAFQKLLNNTKTIGVFGESQLYQTLDYIYGQSGMYATQSVLSNGSRPDAILNISVNNRKLAIDAKFPLEVYKQYLENEETRGNFIKRVKSEIDKISSKYIIEGETLNQAIMFIPSEAIYLDIHQYFEEDILNYAIKKNVWIASKQLIYIYITTIKTSELEYKKNKNADEILKQLDDFSIEFKRFAERYEKIRKDAVKTLDDLKDLETTANKISRSFDNIKNMSE